MTVEQLPDYLRAHWPQHREELRHGTYTPSPVRRVEIPKPDGGVRKLGVPTALDRFVQQAVRRSAAYLTRRSPTTATASLGGRHIGVATQEHLAGGYRWSTSTSKILRPRNHDLLMVGWLSA
jgi:RNA-directed DNA polymerase